MLGGGNGAGSFTWAGLKSLTVFPLQPPHKIVAFYHQNGDVPEVLTIELLLNVLKITCEWLKHDGQ